jgi:hypothetical protein
MLVEVKRAVRAMPDVRWSGYLTHTPLIILGVVEDVG